MTFVTDPDNLDRFQIAVNPILETISIRGLGTQRGSARRDTGIANETTTFTDSGANFVASGVTAGDVLAIVSGSGIGHYTVAGSITTTSFTVDRAIPDDNSTISYKVHAPQSQGQVSEVVADGVTMQALYSFLKEEWRTLDVTLGNAPDLIQFTFPIESITREQFEIGGATHSDWNFAENSGDGDRAAESPRNLIRTGGWAKLDTAGGTAEQWTGIITLGSLDSDTQAYYLQVASGTPSNFVLTGAVNQSIEVFNSGYPAFDRRTFLTLFARKKARSYAQSSIGDIGVSTIETIVNRFPLTHATDPAIVLTDGEMAGDGVNTNFREIEAFAAGSDGVTSASITSGTFDFSSASTFFNALSIIPGDCLRITSGSDQGYYEIKEIVNGTTLRVYAEPSVTYTGGESTLNFTANTSVKDSGSSVGQASWLGGYKNINASGLFNDSTSGKTFLADNGLGDRICTTSDYLFVTNDLSGSGLEGVYKILNVNSNSQLVIDITDQLWPDGPAQLTYKIVRPGMHLQFKNTIADAAGPFSTNGIEFSGGAYIQRKDAPFDWLADNYASGGVVTVANAENAVDDGTYVISEIFTTTNNGDTLKVFEPDGTASAITNNTQDTTATFTGKNGFIRELNSVKYSFNWRLFGNGGGLAECFQWIQKQLRRPTDIDEGGYYGAARGDITDLLMTYASPTATTLNMHIDDIAADEFNNITEQDITGNGKTYAFIAGVTINLNANITNDVPANGGTNKIVVFFTTNPAGDFGTPNAVIVNDATGSPMSVSDQSSTPKEYQYDYDNNAQGGRTPGTNASVTIVAIGTTTAQYVQTTGTITRSSSNVFSLVASLERNYANP